MRLYLKSQDCLLDRVQQQFTVFEAKCVYDLPFIGEVVVLLAAYLAAKRIVQAGD